MPKPLPANRWPSLVILLGLLFLGLTSWSLYRAATGVSGVADRHYPADGLRYNEALTEQKTAENLGWQAAVSLRDGFLESRLTGRDGRPVTGGDARLLIQSGSRGDLDLPLRETADGRYGTPLPDGLRGETRALLSFSREGATLRRTLLLNL